MNGKAKCTGKAFRVGDKVVLKDDVGEVVGHVSGRVVVHWPGRGLEARCRGSNLILVDEKGVAHGKS